MTVLAAPAFAGGSTDQSGADIINGQLNLGPVWSTIKTNVTNSDGDVSAASTAVGNTATIVTMADTHVDNLQTQNGNVGSAVKANVDGVNGNTWLNSTSLCNGASISTDPNITSVNSDQACGAQDPSASVSGTVTNVAGGVGASAMAVSNQTEIDSNASNFPVKNYQEAAGGTNANVNLDLSNVGAASLSSTAVGNTATIVHY